MHSTICSCIYIYAQHYPIICLIFRLEDSFQPNLNKIIKDNENYIRLNTCLNHAGRQAYLDVMFKGFNLGLKRNGKDLYKELINYKNYFNTLKNRNIISDIELNDILFPVSQCTNIGKLDITLIHVVIRTCNVIPKPQGGWNILAPLINDQSIAAQLIRLKKLRNDLIHFGENSAISDSDFKKWWKKLTSILEDLHLQHNIQYNAQNIIYLETCDLGSKHEFRCAMIKSLTDLCFYRIEQVDKHHNINLSKLQNKISSVQCDLSINEGSVADTIKQIDNLKDDLRKLDAGNLEEKIVDIYKNIDTVNMQLDLEIGKINERLIEHDESMRTVTEGMLLNVYFLLNKINCTEILIRILKHCNV